MKILVTGGTGFLGKKLLRALIEKNYKIVLSSRRATPELMPWPGQIVGWPIDFERDQKTLDGVEAVIHLAGENIASSRWTSERKKSILASRVLGTQNVVDMIRRLPSVHTFLSSSAVGYYGSSLDKQFTEDSSAGEGFLAEVCKSWEGEALKLNPDNVRTVLLRTGIVLGRNNGALGKLEPLFFNNAGGPAGSGEQYMSWIHEDDWVQAVLFALENKKISGPVNLTAPEPVTNKSFSAVMSFIFKQPLMIPAPALALRLALGEMADIVLEGQMVIPQKLIDNDYRFRFDNIQSALENLYDINEENREVNHVFSTWQWLPAPLEKVFQFFSDEKNLEAITPPLLQFNVLNKSTEKIMKGTLINYKLKIHGVPVSWQTLIKEWNPPHQFSDTQLKGPYKLWYHVHSFKSVAGGTLMDDRVQYKLPLGALGRIGGHWLVQKDVQMIFDFRRKKIMEYF